MSRERRALGAVERREEMYLSIPPAFQLPTLFMQTIESDPLPDLDPWFFTAALEGNQQFFVSVLRKQFPYRVLVPFAVMNGTDDVFCFDGSDVSGDPSVLVIHTFCDPGWEYRGHWPNYAAWRARAQQLHALFVADDDRYLEWNVPLFDEAWKQAPPRRRRWWKPS